MPDRVTYEFALRVDKMLHIGDGEVKLSDQQEGQQQYEIATFQRAVDLFPWVPGSTLKGALRATAIRANSNLVSQLFGISHEIGQSLGKGVLTCFGAKARPSFWQEKVVRRTRVSEHTGAAEENLLFAMEMVEEGSLFDVVLVLQGQAQMLDLDRELRRLLGVFSAPGGLSIGADKSAGMGALTLAGSITVTSETLDETGWKPKNTTSFAPEPLPTRAELRVKLLCRGPYLARDETKTVPRNDGKTRQITRPDRSPVRGAEASRPPRLSGTGIRGALRKRAAWLIALKTCRGSVQPETKACATTSGVQDLAVIDRVFGAEGWRAGLTVRISDTFCAGMSRHPSVRLDPISHAPVEHALFEIEADHGVAFTLNLAWFRAPDPDEQALLDDVVEDIKAHGLTLGAGSTKGFGWFNCEPTAPRRPTPTGVTSSAYPDKDRILPDSRITLPYRFIEARTDRVGLPEAEIEQAFAAPSLHSRPLASGYCGHLDLSWCFETPLLIGDGGAVRSPQKVGDTFVLPGTTLRGTIRGILAAATHARLDHLNDVALPPRDMRKPNDDRTTFALEPLLDELNRPSTADNPNPHRPALNDTFRPDFLQALFGHVIEPDAMRGTLAHDRAHLKGRVSFGFGWLQNKANVSDPLTFALCSPDPTAIFYDHVGRKVYPADQATPANVWQRLQGAPPGSTDMQSTIRFLEPASDDRTLVFRSRILFHNVSTRELGALLWAVTLGYNPKHRHRIGQAKAFGAGRCFVGDMDMNLRANDGSAVPGATEDDRTQFGNSGPQMKSHIRIFLDWLDQEFGQGDRRALICAAAPAFGAAIRKRAGLESKNPRENEKVAYQTSNTKINSNQTIKQAQGAIRAFNGGRLAAMISKVKE